jgi:uncharacterized membrane protein YeaQ/YmgE (transglycosylase-associated protein family)
MLMTLGALILAVVVIFVLANTVPLVHLLVSLLIWALIGMLAGRLVRGRDFGLIGNIVLGFFGGIVGSILFSLLGLWGIVFRLPYPLGQGIVGVIGSIALIFIMRLIDRNFAR